MGSRVNPVWALALAAALAGPMPAAVQAATPARLQRFEIKGKSIVVPPPAGMGSVLGVDNRLDDFQRAAVPERNELHACFVPDSEVGEYRRSTAGGTASGVSATFQSPRRGPADDAKVRKLFADLRRDLPKELEAQYRSHPARTRELLTKASKKMSTLAGKHIELEVGKAAPLGIARSDERAVVWLTAMRLTSKAAVGRDTSTVVIGAAIVNLRDRATFLYYSARADRLDQTVNLVRPRLLAWVEDCLRANR